jgi:hypothetical protein
MTAFHLNPTATGVTAALSVLDNKNVDTTGWLSDAGEAIHCGKLPLPTYNIILVGAALNDLVLFKDGKHCQFSYRLGDHMATFFFFNTPIKDIINKVQQGRVAFKVKRVMNPIQGGLGEWFRPLVSTLV